MDKPGKREGVESKLYGMSLEIPMGSFEDLCVKISIYSENHFWEIMSQYREIGSQKYLNAIFV